MADILPTRPDPPSDADKEPRVVGLDSEEVSELLSAISSDTARAILSTLHDEPATPSEVADAVDTSIQNAQYHLGKLEDAGLIEPGGTAYSEKGREMTVYAPADRALVVVAGAEDDTSGLQTVLSQLLGGLGAVALGSVVVERLTATDAGPAVSLSSQGGADGGDATDGGAAGGATNATASETSTATAEPTAEPTEQPTAEPTPTEASDDGGVGIAEATETETEAAADTTAAPETEAPQTATETPPTEAPTPEPTPAPTETETPVDTVTTVVETTQSASGGDLLNVGLAALSPAELFFLGGVVTLALAVGYWAITR